MTMSEMLKARCFALENSPTTALVALSMPPIPRPVKTRHSERIKGLDAVVAPIMRPPSQSSTRSTWAGGQPYPRLHLRERNRMPYRPVPWRGRSPVAARSMPHSFVIPGKRMQWTKHQSHPWRSIEPLARHNNHLSGGHPRLFDDFARVHRAICIHFAVLSFNVATAGPGAKGGRDYAIIARCFKAVK